MNDQTRPAHDEACAARKPWMTPAFRTIRADDAQAGPNPAAPEGPFANGS